MELATHHKGVVGNLCDLDQAAVWRETAKDQAVFCEGVPVPVVELDTVAVTFVHSWHAVGSRGAGAGLKVAWV